MSCAITRLVAWPDTHWAETMLDEEWLRRAEYFHSAPICKKWAEHLSVQRNWQYQLLNVLMFQAWIEENQ